MCWSLSLVSSCSCACFTWHGDTFHGVFVRCEDSKVSGGSGFWRKLQETHCKMMDIVTPQKIEIGDIRIVITRVFVYLFGAYYMCECVLPVPQW